MEHNGLVYLEYAPNRSGFAVYADGRRYPAANRQALERLPVLAGADVVTRHADGANIANEAFRLVTGDVAARSFVESDMGEVAEVAGPHRATLSAWVVGDPTQHPAGRVTRFAPGGEPKAVADVIGTIFDPLWYVGTYDRPERNAAFESRFGLTPRWDGSASYYRSMVTVAWRCPGDPTDADFFTRKYDEKVAAGAAPHVAERRVGRYFLKCLLAAWADGNRPKGAEPFFDVRHLFDKQAIDASGIKI